MSRYYPASDTNNIDDVYDLNLVSGKRRRFYGLTSMMSQRFKNLVPNKKYCLNFHTYIFRRKPYKTRPVLTKITKIQHAKLQNLKCFLYDRKNMCVIKSTVCFCEMEDGEDTEKDGKCWVIVCNVT